MAKKKKEALNVLVTEETRVAIRELAERMECSQGEVVDRAVVLLGTNATVERDFEAVPAPDRSDYLIPPPRSQPGAASFAPPSREMQIAAGDRAGWLPCKHCGVDEQIWPKSPNPWKPCADCAKRGHMSFQGCEKCVREAHAQGLAANSTAADVDGIDFDPYQPA
jgi:hypothetical protein